MYPAPSGFTYPASEGGFTTEAITSEGGVPRSTTTGTASTNPYYLRALGPSVTSGLRCCLQIEFTTDDPWPTAPPQLLGNVR